MPPKPIIKKKVAITEPVKLVDVDVEVEAKTKEIEKEEDMKDDEIKIDSSMKDETKDEMKESKKPVLKITKKKVSTTSTTKEIPDKESKGDKDDKESKDARKQEKKEEIQGTQSSQEVLLDVSKAIKSTKKTSKKQDNQGIFNEDDVDYRFVMMNYDFSKNKTLPKITKYEKALLVGKRAKQIEEGANPNVKVLAGQNAIDIAEEELRQRKIPFIIKRPVGNKFEYWRPADMEVIMD